MINEDFLHYIWNFKLFNTLNLKTSNNETVQIIKSGQHNTDAGPDFFNAQIKIDSTTWAGNVEIHIKSSDWDKHYHEKDAAYDNVIMHVVYENDKSIKNSKGIFIPTLELKGIINEKLIENYQELLSNKNWIPCSSGIKDVDPFTINNWLERLVVERLEYKSSVIKDSLELNKNNWEETFYQQLVKYFGLKVNAEPFLLLAKNTSLKIIEKHNNIFSIEAMLFGQAGFLQDDFEDVYFQKLKKEYEFFKSKFSLSPIDKSLWKFLRLRPPNFPTIRIAQLASLLNNEPRLFSKILTINTVIEYRRLFKVQASPYWTENYQFGKTSSKKVVKKTGGVLIDALIINVVVPFLFVYGETISDENIKNRAIMLLQQLDSERNTIINNFRKIGVNSSNALMSQSLIELKTNYCSQKKCLNCSIGNNLIKSI
ncbi:MAG: DUF2851 family protein [Flavobacteriales bacterium]